jgi:hypothetical protein
VTETTVVSDFVQGMQIADVINTQFVGANA